MQQLESDSTEPLTLWKLPDELLIEILRCLDIPSLKKARLTCRRWREAGAHGLFHRVYFAPRWDIMNIFAEITSNPAFASNIKELVYDARLYWAHMTEYGMYARAYRNGFLVEHPENHEADHEDFDVGDLSIEEYNQRHGYDQRDIDFICDSLNHYRSILHEQQSILESRQDFDVLCIGLARLTNLKRITVLDLFQDNVDYRPFILGDFTWYEDWADIMLEEMAPPSRWVEAEYTKPGVALRNYPWDFSGIKNLLRAACLHAPRLRELLLGCELSFLSAKALTSPDFSKVLEKLVTELVVLKVDLTIPDNVSNTRSALPMADVLRKAQKLEHLYLTLFDYTGSHADWNRFLLEVRWPRLRVLDLGEGEVDFITIKTLTHAHADVLRELRLRNVCLRGERGWEEVAQELRGPLKLDFVALLSMYDGASNRIPKARLNQVARQLIGWSRDSDFGIANKDGTVMMWHKENYVHNPLLHLVDGDDDEDEEDDDDDYEDYSEEDDEYDNDDGDDDDDDAFFIAMTMAMLMSDENA